MWYSIFRICSVVLLKACFRLKVVGKENLPKRSNFVIVSNHLSYMDPLVVAAAVPAKIYCIAARDLYAIPHLAWILPKLDALPTGSSSKEAIDLLMNNNIVGLFPEGGISRDGKLREFRRGAALLAHKTGRPIVPCAILGTFEALPLKRRIPKPVPITIRIGKPIFLLKEFDEEIDDISLQEGMFRVRASIKEMLDAGK